MHACIILCVCCVEQFGAIRAVDTVMIAIKNNYCKSKINVRSLFAIPTDEYDRFEDFEYESALALMQASAYTVKVMTTDGSTYSIFQPNLSIHVHF